MGIIMFLFVVCALLSESQGIRIRSKASKVRLYSTKRIPDECVGNLASVINTDWEDPLDSLVPAEFCAGTEVPDCNSAELPCESSFTRSFWTGKSWQGIACEEKNVKVGGSCKTPLPGSGSRPCVPPVSTYRLQRDGSNSFGWQRVKEEHVNISSTISPFLKFDLRAQRPSHILHTISLSPSASISVIDLDKYLDPFKVQRTEAVVGCTLLPLVVEKMLIAQGRSSAEAQAIWDKVERLRRVADTSLDISGYHSGQNLPFHGEQVNKWIQVNKEIFGYTGSSSGHEHRYPRYLLHLTRVPPCTWRNGGAAERSWEGTYDVFTPGYRGGFYASSDIFGVLNRLFRGPDNCLKRCPWLLRSKDKQKIANNPMIRHVLLFEIENHEEVFSGAVAKTFAKRAKGNIVVDPEAGIDSFSPLSMIEDKKTAELLVHDWSEPLIGVLGGDLGNRERVIRSKAKLRHLHTFEFQTAWQRKPTAKELEHIQLRAE